MTLLDILKKRYIVICVLLIAIGLFLDLSFTDAVPIKTTQTIKDMTGKSVTFDVFVFSYKYEILKIITNLCYGLAISILVLLALELKYDEVEKDKIKILEDQERANFKLDIQNLQEKINSNIFNGVLKKVIPEELFNLIEKDVLNKNVLRQNAHWVYDVTEGAKNNYIVTQTITYELINNSQTIVNEFLNVSISESQRCKSYFNFFKIEKNGTIIIEKNKDEIEKEILVKGMVKSNSYPVELKPGEVAKITRNIVHEYIDKSVFGSHMSNYSIIGLTIEINKPENCEFTIHQSFTSILNPTKPNNRKILYEKIPGILLGQGLSYTIEKI